MKRTVQSDDFCAFHSRKCYLLLKNIFFFWSALQQKENKPLGEANMRCNKDHRSDLVHRKVSDKVQEVINRRLSIYIKSGIQAFSCHKENKILKFTEAIPLVNWWFWPAVGFRQPFVTAVTRCWLRRVQRCCCRARSWAGWDRLGSAQGGGTFDVNHPHSWVSRDRLGLAVKCLPALLRCDLGARQALQILWSLPSVPGIANSLVFREWSGILERKDFSFLHLYCGIEVCVCVCVQENREIVIDLTSGWK